MSTRTLLLALLFAAAPAAQAQFAVLPYAGYDFDAENVLLGLGAEFALPIVAPVAVSARPSGEYMFTRDFDVAGRTYGQTIYQVNLDVIVRLKAPGLQPYGGAGIAVRSIALDTSDDDDLEGDQDVEQTNIGANLLGGVVLGGFGPVRPFVQGRVTIGSATEAQGVTVNSSSAFSAVAGITIGF